jgi:hypothetical protein
MVRQSGSNVIDHLAALCTGMEAATSKIREAIAEAKLTGEQGVAS